MFIFDCESHVLPPADDISYFPLYKQNQAALMNGLRRLTSPSCFGLKAVKSFQEVLADMQKLFESGHLAENLVAAMDSSGVQMSCVLPESFLPMSYGARMGSTNGWVAKEVAKFPDRLVGVCNVGPVISRGVKNAVWELEHLIKELNYKAVKLYPVDDTPINNRELWPYYRKISELGVPVFIHMGMSWCVPGRSEYCRPSMLEDICEDFPELTVLAYHMGYPHMDELNMCAMKFPNLYVGTSLLPEFGHGMSRRSQKILGEAILWAGIDKIVWGTDIGALKHEVAFLKEFQISEEVQRDYGYPPLSDEDRAKWAGLNLARILKINPPNP
jgi:uncharacterized protein